MGFMSQHYQCCAAATGSASESNQDLILAALSAVSDDIAAIATGGGAASEAKQDEILAELAKLTKPTMG